MNFVVGLIFAATQDEVITFGLLSKVMFELNWRVAYDDNLTKVLSITRKIQQWLETEQKKTFGVLSEAGVVLEVQMSSPIMALFGNILSV